MIQSHATISIEELVNVLEPLIRRVVREELAEAIEKKPDIFYIEPDTPLYEDMLEIRERKRENDIELYSHKEVWNE
ncbi:hypothetical protein [Desulfonema magnum]|uniref:Uncharacterized protein n=1 Tax=Desulfonema magnum TaxID=45655 RepID=A0A975BEY6_9BACT|nr:hypothetical protein [Desulfonema magnum]QTA84068.1 Uncharacterized protein dnm_000600 [Desulfonema magnum]